MASAKRRNSIATLRYVEDGISTHIPDSVLISWGGSLDVQGALSAEVWLVQRNAQTEVLKKRPLTFDPQLEQALCNTLLARDLPVVQALPTSCGELAHQTAEGRWSLYPHISGRSVSLAHISQPQAHTLGATLARLHLALCEGKSHSRLSPVVLPEHFAQCPRGIIHRDFHARNVLFDGARVSAILDFDLVCEGPLAFDLAYLVASLLADDWSEHNIQARFFEILKKIAQGYHDVRPLLPIEVESIPLLCEEIEELFIRLARQCSNPSMEQSAKTIQAWFMSHRREIAGAVAFGL